ncbi:MAG: bifunctional nicotinamidase/pyrazinamidase [Nitrospinae bacterium]|nr:bifunctional nicotinamidase/pyrazinamidase [Nitrospinota bacterium]
MLIAVDIQYDFIPGGALAVPEGDAIVPAVNRLAELFGRMVATQDWHPNGHNSFASSHPGKNQFDVIQTHYGSQTLWPDHCVQGSRGADIHEGLNLSRCDLVIRKGFRKEMDSYSGFFENDRETPTGLGGYLHERSFKRLFLTGLATDFCVKYTALDGVKLGFEVYVIEDACRGIDLAGSLAAAWIEMDDAGVKRIQSSSVMSW